MKHLDMLLTTSDPGDEIHHLHVVTAPLGPLGTPDADAADDDRQTAVYAIIANDPNPNRTVQQQIAGVIATVAIEAHNERRAVLFAGLSQEAWAVEPFDDHAEKMRKAGISLSEHPNASEVTVSYGATRDGRRWSGIRHLTGPKANETHTELIVGQPTANEGLGFTSRLIRKLVGLPIGH